MKKRRKMTRGFGAFLFAMLGLSIFFYFNFHTVVVTGPSMLPTFKDKQRILVSSAYWLLGAVREGDVVVIRDEDGAAYIIKRVYRKGGGVVEPELQPRKAPLGVEYQVPEGQVYLLGDNREFSEDSRVFGPVPVDKILGKVIRW